MMSTRSLTAGTLRVAILAGMAMAQETPLATITPCPAAPSDLSIVPITVTEQYQPVWTCDPTSVCAYGTCYTSYPMTTFDFLSTVIPCAWSGTSASTCTVVNTDAPVTVSQYTTTITSMSPLATGTQAPGYYVNGTVTETAYATITQVVEKFYVQPFNGLGPMAMPGWGGSGHCDACAEQADGRRFQPMGVHHCFNGYCRDYTETWVSSPGPSYVAPMTAECSSYTSVDAAGTYTFPFTQWAPTTTVTLPGSTVTVTVGGYPTMSWVPEHAITCEPQPWTGYVTRTCTGPTIIDFTTTLTQTVTYTHPYITQTTTVYPYSTSSTSLVSSPTLMTTTTTATDQPITTEGSTVTTPTTSPFFPNSTTTSNTNSATLTSSTLTSTTTGLNTTTTTTDQSITTEGSTTTSTTSGSIGPITTSGTTTTTTADVSADLTVPDPTQDIGITPRRRRAVINGVRRGGRFFKRQA